MDYAKLYHRLVEQVSATIDQLQDSLQMAEAMYIDQCEDEPEHEEP